MIPRTAAITATALLLLTLPVESQSIDLSLFGTYASGDYGTGYDSDVQATVFRFATGDRFQFRFEAPYLRVRSGDPYTMPETDPIPQGGAQNEPYSARSGGNDVGTIDRTGQAQSGPNGSGGANSGDENSLDRSDLSTATSWTSGMGDLWVGGFVRLLGGGSKLYRADTGIGVKAPTASSEDGLGTGEWDYRLSLSGEYRFWSATTFGAVGWTKLGDPTWIDFNDVLDFVAGAESEPLFGRVILSGWLEGGQEAVPGYGGRTAIGLGLRSTGRFRWRALATTGLGGSAEDYAFLFGVSVGVEPPKSGLRGVLF
ncbi:MAG: hypothetical protein P8Y44_01625 [Acidobacteriota bacterium]